MQRARERQSQNQNGNASDALHVGGQYTKALFSKATGTVISNYTKALLSGNGKELKRLGNSASVQQLNTSFSNANHSSQAQSISHSFDSFGRSVSRDFHKIFH
jgi:hypothetical protein